jgi:hypothetical protein
MERYIRFAAMIVCLLVSVASHAQQAGRLTQNDAINIAGMQRMLSQRILKAYCEVGLAESYGDPKGRLASAVNRFDTNLSQLEGFAKAPDIQQALEQVRELWPTYKKLALSAPTRVGAQRLMALNRKLLPAANNVVVKMEKDYGTATGKWVNMAGRQRMLSQRIAMFYLMRIWGVATDEDDSDAAQASDEYSTALKTLGAVERNTDGMKVLIDTMGSQLAFIESAVDKKGDNLSFIVTITSEKMLQNADQLTSLYAEMDRAK